MYLTFGRRANLSERENLMTAGDAEVGAMQVVGEVKKADYSKPDPTRNFDWSEDANGDLLDFRAAEFERQVNELIYKTK